MVSLHVLISDLTIFNLACVALRSLLVCFILNCCLCFSEGSQKLFELLNCESFYKVNFLVKGLFFIIDSMFRNNCSGNN